MGFTEFTVTFWRFHVPIEFYLGFSPFPINVWLGKSVCLVWMLCSVTRGSGFGCAPFQLRMDPGEIGKVQITELQPGKQHMGQQRDSTLLRKTSFSFYCPLLQISTHCKEVAFLVGCCCDLSAVIFQVFFNKKIDDFLFSQPFLFFFPKAGQSSFQVLCGSLDSNCEILSEETLAG